MKRYEKGLIVGTSLNFIGSIMFLWLKFSMIVSWSIIMIGEFLIVLSIMEYKDYKRAMRGEDLTQDNLINKKLRKIRHKIRH